MIREDETLARWVLAGVAALVFFMTLLAVVAVTGPDDRHPEPAPRPAPRTTVPTVTPATAGPAVEYVP